MKHTISILVENKFGVLARIAGMFSGRGFNIDTLNVGPTFNPEQSLITVSVKGDNAQLDQAIKQLHKLINVIEVKDFKQNQFVDRELIMVKIKASSETRSELIQICDIFRAKIIHVAHQKIITELTGDANKIQAFLDIIQPFGIEELARTGNLALERD